jgi:energy-coupling factor transporter ATP-binding protein EcfA2
MKVASIYGAFNARWLEPEDVARSFVPTPHFKSLVRFQNSLLMGPRGCGKTTLLKMLTRRAQRTWASERLSKEVGAEEYRAPDFEAIYIASDIRWSSELASLPSAIFSAPLTAELLQRSLISITSIIEATRTFEELLDGRDSDKTLLIQALVKHFELGPSYPSFPELRIKLRSWMEHLQSLLVRGDLAELRRRLDELPRALTGHALDGITRACTIFDEYVRSASPPRWALCFDEIEIAPSWLQTELFKALRSYEQKFLLKITWSPLLPTDLTPTQERQHDFATIRMWHSHVADARSFCREFTTRYIRDKFENQELTPRSLFGSSLFSQDEAEGAEVYARGSIVWQSMKDLAARDPSFREYLSRHGISPLDPSVADVSVRDESLRKAKPLVILREAFFADIEVRPGRRSRKNAGLYYGDDVIYSMSEGNPRLLAGLLNDLFDTEVTRSKTIRPIPRFSQSRILISASERVLSGIRAYPTKSRGENQSLARLVERLGRFVQDELIRRDFNAHSR